MQSFETYCSGILRRVYGAPVWPAQPVSYTSGKLGLVLLSSGKAAIRTQSEKITVAGAGNLFMTDLPFVLEPLEPCHCLCVVLEGAAADAFCDQLTFPLVQDAGYYPGLTTLLTALCDNSLSGSRVSSVGLELLCNLEPDRAEQQSLPPLIHRAVTRIRTGYANLYGIEELADELGVTKSHLVRVFHAALGVTPGQYLTDVRIETARQLLLQGNTLEVVATLCGFSGANYLCKVFRKRTGQTPVEYRRAMAAAGLTVENDSFAAHAEADLF